MWRDMIFWRLSYWGLDKINDLQMLFSNALSFHSNEIEVRFWRSTGWKGRTSLSVSLALNRRHAIILSKKTNLCCAIRPTRHNNLFCSAGNIKFNENLLRSITEAIDLIHKSHNAPVSLSTMHNFVGYLYIYILFLCIVGFVRWLYYHFALC